MGIKIKGKKASFSIKEEAAVLVSRKAIFALFEGYFVQEPVLAKELVKKEVARKSKETVVKEPGKRSGGSGKGITAWKNL